MTISKQKMVSWLDDLSKCRSLLVLTLFDRTMAGEIRDSLKEESTISEDDIIVKLITWVNEGERMYPNPVNSNHSGVKEFIQTLGWEMEDLRTTLQRSRATVRDMTS